MPGEPWSGAIGVRMYGRLKTYIKILEKYCAILLAHFGEAFWTAPAVAHGLNEQAGSLL